MTQQPYYPPAQPPQGYPPQQPPPAQYPPQYPQAPAPAPGYPPQQPQQPYAQPMAQPGYPPQPYGQQPPGPPPVPLAEGSLDAFYSQPSAGAGPGIGWSDKAGNQRPVGTTWVGVVARDVTNADVQQMTDMRTKQPVFYQDGRPKFQMKVPLKQVALFNDPGLTQPLQLPADMPEAEGTWYVKGQARDELTRAMAEAGSQGAPTTGAVVFVTLVNRRATGGGMNPANIVQVRYVAPEGGQASAPAPAQPPVQEQAQPAPPVQQAPPQAQPPMQYAVPAGPPQPTPQQPVYQVPQQAAPQVQQQEQAPQWAQPPVQGQPQLAQPVQQQGQPPQFSGEQAALFAKITQGQQQAPQQGQPAA